MARFNVHIITEKGRVHQHDIETVSEEQAVQAALVSELMRLINGDTIKRVVPVLVSPPPAPPYPDDHFHTRVEIPGRPQVVSYDAAVRGDDGEVEIVKMVSVDGASFVPANQVENLHRDGTKCVSGESAMEHLDHNQGRIPKLEPGDDGR